MACKHTFILAAVFAMLVLSSAQSFNCDEARGLGTPSKNQCGTLCNEVVKRNAAYAQLKPYCNQMCVKCVGAVQQCKLGAKQPLPSTCQTAFKFPVVLSVINDYLKQTSTEKAKGH